jgi:hypothetical protein
MEQARRLLERLERIERLHAAGEPRTTLLQQLRALLEDGERAATGGPLRRAVAAGARKRRS